MKRWGWLLAGGGVALLLPLWAAAPEPGKEGDSAEVKKLLRERRDVLTQAVAARGMEYELGARLTSGTDLGGLSRELLGAELELARRPGERVAAHQAHFSRMRMMENLARGHYNAGLIPLTDYMRARAARLEAEAGLRRAGGKPKAEKEEGK
jgi:hypothetical protein